MRRLLLGILSNGGGGRAEQGPDGVTDVAVRAGASGL
jgi:hypothetical protein